jgi:hypothetical protein
MRGQIVMNSHKRVQNNRPYALAPSQYSTLAEPGLSERIALTELLHGYRTTTLELRHYVRSLETRLRNVSFVDVRQLFHRIGDASEHCASFLSERIQDLGGPSRHTVLNEQGVVLEDSADMLSFAGCIHQIGIRTNTLATFASQAKSFMDQAVINGDYNSLHVMTDCVYQISQLIALIQIHLPTEPSMPVTTSSPSLVRHSI